MKMNHEKVKYYFYGVMLVLLASVMGLWAWNTLAELFSGPQAQYKHVLALLVVLAMVKWGLFHDRTKHKCNRLQHS
jgi:hypothetical protein